MREKKNRIKRIKLTHSCVELYAKVCSADDDILACTVNALRCAVMHLLSTKRPFYLNYSVIFSSFIHCNEFQQEI